MLQNLMQGGSRCQRLRGPVTSLSGNVTMARNSPSTPSTAMPTIRKGISRIHTSGYATNASKASGQQSTSRMHQSRKFMTVDTERGSRLFFSTLGRDDLRAREACSLETLTRRVCLLARGERPGDHLLPSSDHPSAY